ncbi:MAG: hypothetical protein ACI8XM_002082 [Haloarculaceae archaeon]|jgi:hypothetical protein
MARDMLFATGGRAWEPKPAGGETVWSVPRHFVVVHPVAFATLVALHGTAQSAD